uniref:peroxisomal sarcosine oxidase isoform X3 n=1 Tax=Gasterosteus aculeatus aculeatus TaxID=481459 RepID=UPI001A99B512|nr:peroxisomal sarcosine oxidase isoform X3 [Gasterosteus aculeatus aculeatus]XP_040050330.1 peroxisomal sarcosine oxidase isoform X3 [Gasterosteus aculeatus aculeatus]XP_040050339.1 peroxisomal sarcosine oxidase isoform X3 [Gasterosteus aculeatus aculeatus]
MMVTVLYTSSASSPTVWNRMAILTVSSLSNAPEAVIYSWKRCSHLLQFSAIFPFVLPHTRGSSHGQTRIIRKAYQQDFYTHMMEECYELWAQLEREAGVKLYRQTGLLVMGPEESQGYQMIKNTLQKNKVPIEILNRDNFSQHIPNVNLALGDGAMVDITAGVLYADRALKTVQRQFEKLGGVIRDNEQVTDVKPGPVVTVTTSAGVYRAKSVVVTAGPWANRLLAHTGLQLPLTVVKINVCYWKEKVPGSYNVKQRFPCFLLTEFEETKDIYGLPSNEYPGLMKVETIRDTADNHRGSQDKAGAENRVSPTASPSPG